jgi:hypothetical protein
LEGILGMAVGSDPLYLITPCRGIHLLKYISIGAGPSLLLWREEKKFHSSIGAKVINENLEIHSSSKTRLLPVMVRCSSNIKFHPSIIVYFQTIVFAKVEATSASFSMARQYHLVLLL